MSKKSAKSAPVHDANTTSVNGESATRTIYDQLEQSVWNLPTPSEQYEAFNKLFNYHVGGICHETILSEEIFLVAVQCRKQLLESLQRQQFQTRRQAFDWVCDYLKQRTATEEEVSGLGNIAAKLSADQCCHIVQYISDSILKEFDLFAAVLGYPMDHEIMNISKRLPTPISALPSLSSAKYEPMQCEPEPIIKSPFDHQQQQEQQTKSTDGESDNNKLDETKEKIIARMVAIDISKAKAEVDRTIANYKSEIESRMKA